MTPGSFGQLFSDVLYYLIDGRLGRFYEESMADEELAHLSLAFAVDRGRISEVCYRKVCRENALALLNRSN